MTRPRGVRSASAHSHTDNTTDTVNCGTGTSLTNLTAFSVLVLVRPSSVANTARNICGKVTGTTGGWEWFKRGTDGTILRFSRYRATTAGTVDTNTAALTVNEWQLFGVSWDDNAVGNCRVVRAPVLGNRAGVTVDVTNSGTLTVGSGAPASDAAQPLRLFGNSSNTSNGGWPGAIGAYAVIPRVMSLRDFSDAFRAPWQRLNAAGLWFPGDQGAPGAPLIDWSGNGNHGLYSAATNFTTIDAPPLPLFVLNRPRTGLAA